MGEGFCARVRLHEVPVRLGLTSGQLVAPGGYWDYQHGRSEGSGWRWWSAACGYSAYAEEGDRVWFRPRGTVTVKVFSDPEAARAYYMDALETLADHEPLGAAAPVHGWWERGIAGQVLDTSMSGSPFQPFLTVVYHLHDANLYVRAPLASEISRRGDTERGLVDAAHKHAQHVGAAPAVTGTTYRCDQIWLTPRLADGVQLVETIDTGLSDHRLLCTDVVMP